MVKAFLYFHLSDRKRKNIIKERIYWSITIAVHAPISPQPKIRTNMWDKTTRIPQMPIRDAIKGYVVSPAPLKAPDNIS